MFVVGVDIGGTKVLARVFDPLEPTGWFAERRIPTAADLDTLVRDVAGLVEELRAALAVHEIGASIDAAGVGIAGLVDRSGTLRSGPNLPGIIDAPIRELITEAIGCPVVVENDATAATWAEHVGGAGVGVDELVLVTLGTGIGVGLVSSGRLVVGTHGFAGEAGHMIVDPNGPLCPCGQRGCWERYASGSGLGRLGREAAEAGCLSTVVASVGGDPEAVRGVHVTEASLGGDPDALAVLDDFAWWVALGLANLSNLLDPALLIIGGGLVTAGEILLDRVRTTYLTLLYASDRRDPATIVGASLGEEAGAIGAGLLAASRAAEPDGV